MLAFTNTEVTKKQLTDSLKNHAKLDHIRSGTYWGSQGGCAVGCSIHDFRPKEEGKHSLYPVLFGIPQELAYLEDRIFENLPYKLQKTWPLRFANAIKAGADLTLVWGRFALWLLVDAKDGVVKYVQEKKHERQKKAIEAVAKLFEQRIGGDAPSGKEWRAAAAAAATYAAAYAAAAAYATDAAYAAAAAAYAADAAAAYAADAYAADAAAAYAAARQKAFVRQSEKLIELLKAA